ncbi:MAG: hypothetical protein HYY84_01910 [Deltaproteobacteria bacterium]|nr:hypothetical protein [Deltaproteobacteria bacterium]
MWFLLFFAGCAGMVVPKNHWNDFHGFKSDKPVFVDTDEGVVHFTVQSPLTIVDAKGEKIVARFKSISIERDTFVGRTRDGREIRMSFAQIARLEVDGKALGEVGTLVEKKTEQRRGLGQRGAGSF